MDTIRALAYKKYNLEPSTLTFILPLVSILERANVGGNLPGRHISNMKELKESFKTQKVCFLQISLFLVFLSCSRVDS